MTTSRTVPAARTGAALTAAAGLAGYFQLTPGDAEPLAVATGGAGLASEVEQVRAVLQARMGGPVTTRVAASIHSLGLMSRIVSAPLATAVLYGIVPRMSLEMLGRQRSDGPVRLRRPVEGSAVVDVAGTATALHDHVVTPVLSPLVEAFAQLSVSRRVLWGNAASALAGAAGLIQRQAVARIDPRAVITVLTASGPLAATGVFGVDGRYFRRSSCCLYYRLPGGGTCGDCVLTGVDRNRAR